MKCVCSISPGPLLTRHSPFSPATLAPLAPLHQNGRRERPIANRRLGGRVKWRLRCLIGALRLKTEAPLNASAAITRDKSIGYGSQSGRQFSGFFRGEYNDGQIAKNNSQEHQPPPPVPGEMPPSAPPSRIDAPPPPPLPERASRAPRWATKRKAPKTACPSDLAASLRNAANAPID